MNGDAAEIEDEMEVARLAREETLTDYGKRWRKLEGNPNLVAEILFALVEDH